MGDDDINCNFWHLILEFTGVIGDSKSKSSKEKKETEFASEIEGLRQDLEDAELQSYRLGWLVTHLRTLANEKLYRIRRHLVELTSDTRPSIARVRLGLQPETQIRLNLELLASLFRVEVVSKQDGYVQNFRVGLFAEDSGILVPVDAFDLASRSHDPFTSHQKHTDRYQLENSKNPSHAVRCVLEGRAIIVPDCANDATFDYFDEKQREYLRSMVAYPIDEFCRDGVNRVRAAIILDTNVAGYFREENREMIEMRIREFVVRINLEYAIRRLTG